ncbi:hypothetical protein Hanom_Chr07g00645751 [Helianthus anomalus]
MATSPHSNPEVAGSSLARSQCPYGSGFTPRIRFAGCWSARWDHLEGWEDHGISPPPPTLKHLILSLTYLLFVTLFVKILYLK